MSLALASTALGGAAPERSGETPRAEAAPPNAVICHKGETLTVAEPARDAHLGHGDTAGACATASAPSAAAGAEVKPPKPKPKAAKKAKPAGSKPAEGEARDAAAEDKVAICHKGRRTLSVGASARAAHLAHGDTLGACTAAAAPKARGKSGEPHGRPADKPAKAPKAAGPAKPDPPGKAKGHGKP